MFQVCAGFGVLRFSKFLIFHFCYVLKFPCFIPNQFRYLLKYKTKNSTQQLLYCVEKSWLLKVVMIVTFELSKSCTCYCLLLFQLLLLSELICTSNTFYFVLSKSNHLKGWCYKIKWIQLLIEIMLGPASPLQNIIVISSKEIFLHLAQQTLHKIGFIF